MLDKVEINSSRRKRATLKDIAALAGVGTATVERALHSRGNVRPETCRRILTIARDLEYFPTLPDLHQGVLRIDVLLVRPETLFYARLSQAFKTLAASLGKDIQVHRNFVGEADIAAFVARIRDAPYRRSALVIACPSHPDILEALYHVASDGLPVIQIVTRNLPGLPYVGIDNHAAGRTAALCLTRSLSQRSGSLLALCHSMTYANHRERIEGFSDFLSGQAAQQHRLADILFDGDDPDEAARLLHQAILDNPDLIGVYTAGGDNLRIGEVLRRHRQRSLCWIGHEVNPVTRACLIDGTMSFAIDQTPETQAGLALHLSLQKLGIIPALIGFDPPQFRLVTSENIG